MTARKKRWLIGIAAVVVLVIAGVIVAASILVRRFEPLIRQQAVQYLEQRFHSDVELAALHIHLPKVSAWEMIWKRGRGVKVGVEGQGLSMRFGGMRDLPPLFSIRKFRFVVDLGSVLEPRKVVDSVTLDGMQINIPPKRDRPQISRGGGKNDGSSNTGVLIEQVQITNAVLLILPKDSSKEPLRFPIYNLRMNSEGSTTAMKYDASLLIPKPPGQVHSSGHFGPWAADEPGDSPLDGTYTFKNADLGVFRGIAGILQSTGTFDGTLDSIHARGEATVPDFRLKMTGTPVPLHTNFEVLVDGTNGNTHLQPVRATLGSTAFTTTGAVIKHEARDRRSVQLKVTMPNGDMRDLLRLAVKGSPFMEGRITMHSTIDIPPLSGKVAEKLRLDGAFRVDDSKFLRSTIQDQIDKLSRKGQGQPENQEIDEVVSDMSGSFHLENQVMTFRSLTFRVPGARVALAGNYDTDHDKVDFRGTLKLNATVSQTMTGWKRWVLKPVDPFFSKNGAGTFLKIKVDGDSRHPNFGLDHGA
ncbi:MAG: AsmA-like C-terminal region-containing protein [Bryobacteraceae bacterium]